jgi:hypothetical protein
MIPLLEAMIRGGAGECQPDLINLRFRGVKRTSGCVSDLALGYLSIADEVIE